MRLVVLAAVLLTVGTPSKTVRLAIVHTVRGCHVWQLTRDLGPSGSLKLRAGTKVELRVNCPMDFRLVQTKGPKLALGSPTLHTGTSRTFTLTKRGTYVLQATNLQSSVEQGLQTLGPDNVLRLTITVS
jgi:hypothetical protein